MSSRRVRRSALLGVLAVVLAACNTTETGQGTSDLPRPTAATLTLGPGSPEPQSTVPAAGLLVTPGAARRAIDAIVREIGPRPVRYVNLYDSYVILEAQDPAKPENIDRFTFRDGRVGPFEPVNVSGQAQEDIEADLFAFTDVNWSAIPDLTRVALEQTALEGGDPSLVSVERGLPSTPEVRIDVYLSGTRRNGSLEATADGTVLEVRVT